MYAVDSEITIEFLPAILNSVTKLIQPSVFHMEILLSKPWFQWKWAQMIKSRNYSTVLCFFYKCLKDLCIVKDILFNIKIKYAY